MKSKVMRKTRPAIPRAGRPKRPTVEPIRRPTGRLVTLRTNGQITLPAELRERVGARTGDVFVAEVEKDTVVLRPKRLVDPADAWFWTPAWQKAEREADADIKAGRVYRAKNVEDLIASLKR